MDNTNCNFVESEDIDMMDVDITNDKEEMVEGVIESRSIGNPLFHVNLDHQFNEGFYDCLAEKSVRIRRELHPILKTVPFVDGNCVGFPFMDRSIFMFLHNTRGMDYLQGPSQLQFIWRMV